MEVRLCRPGEKGCRRLEPGRISETLPAVGPLLWVDIDDPGPEEIRMLREEFRFHRLALEEAAQHRMRPKVREYPGYSFAVLYVPLPGLPGEALRTAEVDLFIGRNYVVTLHQGAVPALEEAAGRWERTDPELRNDVGFLVHTVVDTLVDAYFPVVDAIEDRLDRIELGIFAGRLGTGRAGAPAELLAVKRSLYTLRRTVYPMREVFNTFLRRDHALFGEATHPYFQDVYDHVLRLLDIVDIQRDMATGILDAQLTVISNRLNETMKTLAAAAVCVAVAAAVFGAWGMNFNRVPLDYMGLKGFFIVSGGTLLLMALIVLWLQRKGI